MYAGMRKVKRRAKRLLRHLSMATLDALLLEGAVARLSFRLGLHGTLRITRFEIKVVGKTVGGKTEPSAPLVVGFASDFHAGATTDPAIFSALCKTLAVECPDVLLLGGDFVSWKAADTTVLTDRLAAFKPRLGTYAVLGNHDSWAGAARVSEKLMAAGVTVLANRHVALPAPFAEVSICGIEDPITGRPDAAQAFHGAGPVRIFLTHAPDGILFLRGAKFDVALAGHTHGGQIALTDGTPIVSAGGPLSRSHSRGRFPLPGNGPLFVSRGIGCSNLPLRINADPELVMLTLKFV